MFSARIRHQKEVRVTGLGWAGALVGTRYFLSANDNILTDLLIGHAMGSSGPVTIGNMTIMTSIKPHL